MELLKQQLIECMQNQLKTKAINSLSNKVTIEKNELSVIVIKVINISCRVKNKNVI